jgi:hypothetical protein
MAATFREKALFVVPDPPGSCMIAPPTTPRNERNISGRDPLGPGLYIMLHPNFAELPFHALLGWINGVIRTPSSNVQ